ncbi:granzyme B-like [Echeneis naucrates]|uniref:trypsin n=1 Tax=Echeneis naucrates TaxID=173247 RepID=A0A665UZ04_ECHNA|nr:granzyme B-like [Echeneis naucrates]
MLPVIYVIFLFELFSLTGATDSGITGGKVSKPHSRPYMASLQVHMNHVCGGILIREDFVLTVAHCYDPRGMTVVLGAHNISRQEESQQRIPVAKYHQHPKYNQGMDYDIMLLKLRKKAKLNKYVKVMGLPKKNGKTPANIKCTVAGWGQTQDNGPSSKVLKEATEKIQFGSECKNKWQQYYNTGHMVCTKFDRKNGGICQGDSGGPLICNSKPVGLAAYTLKSDCSDPKYPHVFTKIDAFLPWIKEIMKA